MSTDALVAAFLAERPDWAPAREALARVLADHLAAGRAAWPDAVVVPETFARQLARGAAEEIDAEELAGRRGDEVYLACACAGGDQRAMVALEARSFMEVDIAAARLRASADLADEVKQMLRRILFVSEGTRPAAAGRFAGRGDLRGWVKVSAVRELQRLLMRDAKVRPSDDEVLFDLVSPGGDPELAVLKESYRSGLVEAVRAAMLAAPPRDRALLRYHVVDGLSIDEIGALYGVNRTTAWRWLGAAREGILVRTREELTRRLGIAPDEVDSVIRLARSRLDLSLESVLRA